MARNRVILTLSLMATLVFLCGESLAQRGRGGGGFGGGARAGGGFSGGGGAARATPSNRSPSMSHLPSSRPAPSARPAGMPSTGARPAATPATRPGAGLSPAAGTRSSQLSAAGRQPGTAAGRAASPAASSFSRPQADQLGNFLNLPSQGHAGAFSADGSPPSAAQLPSSGGPRTIETARGGTITVGGQRGSTQVGDATVGGGVGGIHIETAGGQTFSRVAGGVGATDGSNAAIRGGSATAGQGYGGSFANVKRGYADTTGQRAGGSATAVQGRYGYTAANVRGGYGQGGTGQVGSVSAVRGPGGNVVSGGRGASFVNGQFVGGQSWAAVNGAYTRWNAYTPGWAAQYPGAWWPGKWAVAGTAWAIATWPYAAAYSGTGGDPVYYDYGDNVAYEDGNVYMDDQQVATAEDYYNQADEIAQAGTESSNDDWLPLGVFAVIAGEGQTHTDKVVQLALNRDGAIRGNYQDMLANTVTPVTGAVDKSTQRVSMKLEGNDSLIVETGLYNLTNDEVPVLIHQGPDQQEGRVLIRLQPPEDQTEE